jgi:hypothetical protein
LLPLKTTSPITDIGKTYTPKNGITSLKGEMEK